MYNYSHHQVLFGWLNFLISCISEGQWNCILDVFFFSLVLIDSSNFRNPATFLHAYTCLPLAYGTRQAAGAILQDVADSGILFAILMCKHKVNFHLLGPLGSTYHVLCRIYKN